MNNQIIKHTEQCKVYKQIALLKLKLLIVAVFMLMLKRNGEINWHKSFDSFSFDIAN